MVDTFWRSLRFHHLSWTLKRPKLEIQCSLEFFRVWKIGVCFVWLFNAGSLGAPLFKNQWEFVTTSIWQLQHSASSQFLGIWVVLKQNHDPPIGK
jgi:hypothetical protein